MKTLQRIRDSSRPLLDQPLVVTSLFVCLAAVLRFAKLENQSLWNDEMFSLDVASSAVATIQAKLIAHYHHPPLYFYFAHWSIGLFGYSAASVRAVSALFGSLTVGLVYFVGTRMFGRRAGFASGLLCLVSPFHLAYSQEARPYALAGFLCLLSTFALYRLLDRWSLGRMITYALSALALLYTHHWGIFVIGSHVVGTIIVLRPSRQTLARLMVPGLLIVLFYLPEAVALRQQVSSHEQGGWFWAQSPDAGTAIDLTLAYAGSYFKMASSFLDSPGWIKILSLSCLWLLGLYIAVIIRNSGNNALRYVSTCLIMTLLVPIGIAVVRPEVFLWYRYTVITFPLFCICLGAAVVHRGVNRLVPARIILSVSFGVLVVIGVVGTGRYYSWQKSNVRAIVAYTEGISSDSVQMIIRPRSFAPLFQYYYRGTALERDETYLDQPLGEIVDTARSFIYISLDMPNPIKQYMDYHFDTITERRFPGEAHMGMIVTAYRQKPDL